MSATREEVSKRLRTAADEGSSTILAEVAALCGHPDREVSWNALARAISGVRLTGSRPQLWDKADRALQQLARTLLLHEIVHAPKSRQNTLRQDLDMLAESARFGPAPPGIMCRSDNDKTETALMALLPMPAELPTDPAGYVVMPVTLDPATTLRLWLEHKPIAPFPWGPLVRWYIETQPVDVQANTRPDPILPAPLIMANKNHRQAQLFAPAHRLVQRTDGQAYLPGMAPGQADGEIEQPCLPLALYDLGRQNARGQRGRGAPLALRMFIEVVLNVPLAARGLSQKTGVRLPAMRLREMVGWLYGKSIRNYRPHKHWPRLLRALEALQSTEARIAWQDPATGHGATRQVVVPVDIPRNGRLDDWVQFTVHLPPGSGKGPIIDRPALQEAGLISAPAYRLALGLSFLWHDPGRLRIPTGKGRTRQWRQAQDNARYTHVTDAMLIALTFPVGGSTTEWTARKRLERAREALRFLDRIGFCEQTPTGCIKPGPKWAGWRSR